MLKYSLIVPVYNVQKYIEKCISSILDQDYANYEIIIVDDGSTDKSAEIIDRIANLNRDKIVSIHQENKGLGGARNTGLEKATGKYVWFIDSDDTIAPYSLKHLDEFIQKQEVDILVFDRVAIDELGNEMETEVGVDFEHEDIFSLEKNPQMLYMSPSACNKIFRKELFEKTKICFPDKIWFEDLYTIPKLYLQADKMGYLHESLYLYLQRDGSIMNNRSVEKNIDITTAANEIITYYKKEKKYEQYHSELEYLTIINVYLLASVRVIRGNRKSELLKGLKAYMKDNFPNYKSNVYYPLVPEKYKLLLRLLDKEQYWLIKMLFLIKSHLRK